MRKVVFLSAIVFNMGVFGMPCDSNKSTSPSLRSVDEGFSDAKSDTTLTLIDGESEKDGVSQEQKLEEQLEINEKNINRLKDLVDELSNDLKESKEIEGVLKENIVKLSKDKESLKKKHEELLKDKESLIKEYEELLKTNESLKIENNKLKRDQESNEKHIRDLEKKLEELEKKVEFYEKENEDLKSKVKKKEKYIKYSEEDLEELGKKVESYEKENEDLKSKVKNQEDSLNSKEEYIKYSEEELKKLEEKNTELKRENDNLKRENKNLFEIIKSCLKKSELIEELTDKLSNRLSSKQSNEQLIEQNQQLRTDNPETFNGENALVAAGLLPLAEELAKAGSDQNFENESNKQDLPNKAEELAKAGSDQNFENESNKQDLSNENDWGMFCKETNDGEIYLKGKDGPFLLIMSNSLSHKDDYVKFGCNFWKKLDQFKLLNDARGNFSFSKSDFTDMGMHACLPLFHIGSPSGHILLSKEFIYKGDVKEKSSIPHGKGKMLKNTGEVLIGEFEEGKYKGSESQ